MYYTVIKHDGHLRTRGKFRKHEPQASVFYISRVFSNVRSVLPQCNTRLRLLHLLYDIDFTRVKTRFFYALYSDKTWVFDQSKRAQGLIYVIKNKYGRSELNWDQIFSLTIYLYNKKCEWCLIVDPIWLVWPTYISHWSTDPLTEPPVHNIPDAPTKRYFFTKK